MAQDQGLGSARWNYWQFTCRNESVETKYRFPKRWFSDILTELYDKIILKLISMLNSKPAHVQAEPERATCVLKSREDFTFCLLHTPAMPCMSTSTRMIPWKSTFNECGVRRCNFCIFLLAAYGKCLFRFMQLRVCVLKVYLTAAKLRIVISPQSQAWQVRPATLRTEFQVVT